MSDAVERLVNLAFFLADARVPVSAERVRSEVAGYPEGQDETAFLRMFERDKDTLRSAGLSIVSTPEGRYHLDTAATFASEITLSAEEAATLRAVAAAMLEDPGFPFAEELRLAMAKIATADKNEKGALGTPDAPVVARLTDERPSDQAGLVAVLDAAVSTRKRVTFNYRNAKGEHKPHEVEPFGMFAWSGAWYLVGRDIERDDIRVYALSRASNLAVNASRPRTPDFEPPADFDVSRFVGLPFQYGVGAPFEAALRFEPAHAWRAASLSAGQGSLSTAPDGSVTWRIDANDERRLLRWIVENGPGISAKEPPGLADSLAESLSKVVALHG